MNYLDLIIGILLLLAVIIGFRRGFIRQLFALLALLLGVYCAYECSYFAAHYIAAWTAASETLVNAGAFAITFIAVLVGVYFVGIIADKMINMIAFEWLNKLLGMVLALVQQLLVLGVLAVILDRFALVPGHLIAGSMLYRPVKAVGMAVFPYLQGLFS